MGYWRTQSHDEWSRELCKKAEQDLDEVVSSPIPQVDFRLAYAIFNPRALKKLELFNK